MDVRLFHDRVYDVAILTLFVVLFCIYGMMLITTQYLQNVRDYSPEEAGLVLGTYTIPVMVLSPVAGVLVARSGSRRPILAGLVCADRRLGAPRRRSRRPDRARRGRAAPHRRRGGLVLTPTTNAAMEAVPPDRGGMASGILSAQRALGSTAGFAIMGSVLAGVDRVDVARQVRALRARAGPDDRGRRGRRQRQSPCGGLGDRSRPAAAPTGPRPGRAARPPPTTRSSRASGSRC